MSSFWMPKKQPLYAPMLSTFGGGSARGFGSGLPSGGGGLAGTADYFSSANTRNSGTGWEPNQSYRTGALTLGWEQNLGSSGSNFKFVWSTSQNKGSNPVYTGTIDGDGQNAPTITSSTNPIYTTTHSEGGGGARDIAWFRDGSGFVRTSWYFTDKMMKYSVTVPTDGTFPSSNTNVTGSGLSYAGGIETDNGTWGISQYDESRDRIYFGSSNNNTDLFYFSNWSTVTSSTTSILPTKINLAGVSSYNSAFYGVEYDPWADVLYIYSTNGIDVWDPDDLTSSGFITAWAPTGFNYDLLIATRYYLLGGAGGWVSRY